MSQKNNHQFLEIKKTSALEDPLILLFMSVKEELSKFSWKTKKSMEGTASKVLKITTSILDDKNIIFYPL